MVHNREKCNRKKKECAITPIIPKYTLSQGIINDRTRLTGYGVAIAKFLSVFPPEGDKRLYIGIATEYQRNNYPHDHKKWLKYTYVEPEDIEDIVKPYLAIDFFKENPIELEPNQKIYLMVKTDYKIPGAWLFCHSQKDVYPRGYVSVYDPNEKKWKAGETDLIFFTWTETKIRCEDITTKEECEAAGCYWYNNACHTERPKCEDLLTKEECEKYGCYWYDNACHSEKKPTYPEEIYEKIEKYLPYIAIGMGSIIVLYGLIRRRS